MSVETALQLISDTMLQTMYPEPKVSNALDRLSNGGATLEENTVVQAKCNGRTIYHNACGMWTSDPRTVKGITSEQAATAVQVLARSFDARYTKVRAVPLALAIAEYERGVR